MEQTFSWETDSRSDEQQISCLLRNSTVRYRVHNTRHLTLSWACYPINANYPHFFKMHYNIIFLFRPRQTSSSNACYMPRPSTSPWFLHPNNIWWAIVYRLWSPFLTFVITCVVLELHNEELHNLYSSPSIIRVLKSRRRWAGHVARKGEKRNVYRILVGKPEGKRPLGRPRRRWADNSIFKHPV
jgi:hypothetical protein